MNKVNNSKENNSKPEIIYKQKTTKQANNLKSGEKNSPPGIFHTIFSGAITGLSVIQIVKQMIALIAGLLFISAGIYIISYDDVPVTVVDAKVSSVTWDGNNGCKSEEVTIRRGQKRIQWECDVVATYRLSETEDTYSFSNTGVKYKVNQRINLYRIDADGSMTHNDPNTWKNFGWFFVVFGLLITLMALFWLWICTRGGTLFGIPASLLCAAKSASGMLIKNS